MTDCLSTGERNWFYQKAMTAAGMYTGELTKL